MTHDDPEVYRELGFGKVAHRKVAGFVPHDVGDPGTNLNIIFRGLLDGPVCVMFYNNCR